MDNDFRDELIPKGSDEGELHRIAGFVDLSTVPILKTGKQRFGNWICFRREAPTLLVPLEALNVNTEVSPRPHLRTE
jgi:hypothetical protein